MLTCFSKFNSIKDAIEKYQEIKKEFSRISRISSVTASKIEEGISEQAEFDLSDYLHDMHTSKHDAGHRPKHLGVIWKDLSVEVTNRYWINNMHFKKLSHSFFNNRVLQPMRIRFVPLQVVY
jgi:hypothetical protein